MPRTNNFNSSGKGVLFLIIGAIVIIIIVFFVVTNFLMSPREPEEIVEMVKGEMPEPIYEVVIGDIKFVFMEAEDMGNILRCEDRISPPSTCLDRHDFTTTDKFIKVEITAQNIGQHDLQRRSWSVEDLVDSEGRYFSSAGAGRWIPEESECGVLLKPGFTPISCIEIYAVAERSIGLRVGVSGDGDGFLDLDLYHEKYCWDNADCACGINKYTNDCFVGNKTYVADSDSSAYPQELIEECNNFCAGRQVQCAENECKLY